MYYRIDEKASRSYFPSAQMARYIAGVDAEQVSPALLHAAKRAVLDTVGAALAGAVYGDIAQPVLNYLLHRGGMPQATLWADGTMLPVDQAAFWAACTGHALELDDGHREGAAHIGTVVVPAALCLGEYLGASGTEVLGAVVAGYEVMGRVAAGINPRHFLRGFHTTGCTGSFGSVAAACVLLGLDESQVRGALGTAGVHFTGLLEVVHTGQMVKGIHAGRAAEAGIMAAQLAAAGVRGPEAILEGPKAYVHAMTDRVDWDRMLDGLGGDQPEILKAYIKPYPTCRHCHPSIDMALSLYAAEGALSGSQIQSIRVTTYSVAIEEVGQILHPANNTEAKFSAAWGIASALHRGRAVLADFADTSLTDPALHAIAGKVSFALDPARDQAYPHKRGACLELTMADGRMVSRVVELPKGEPETALTDGELTAKFLDLASGAVGPGRARQAAQMIWQLDQLNDVGTLIQHLLKGA